MIILCECRDAYKHTCTRRISHLAEVVHHASIILHYFVQMLLTKTMCTMHSAQCGTQGLSGANVCGALHMHMHSAVARHSDLCKYLVFLGDGRPKQT